jgi:hypothetical protein
MSGLRTLVAALLALATLTVTAAAQAPRADIQGARDHALVGR